MAEAPRELAIVLVILGLAGCGPAPKPEASVKPAPAAKVEHAAPEAALATVTLTAEAEKRLGIQTALIERRSVARVRSWGGELMAPRGRSFTVAAPVAGTLTAAATEPAPAPGGRVHKGQALFRLTPLLAAEGDLRAEAERAVAAEQARAEAARARLQRAEQTLRDKAGSARAVEEARSELAVVEAALKAARARQDRLRRAPLEAEDVLVISSPADGVLQQLHAGAGQIVAAGAAVAEIVALDPLWVRVPVYVGEAAAIEPRRPARVHGLGDAPGKPALTAWPIPAPPSANPDAATVDLFFEIANAELALRPGQKVGVTLELRGAAESLTAPWSAILYDIHGGAWVYENPRPQVYARRRVEVRYVAGRVAVLDRGPAPGTRVVSTGAAELFGTEFGPGK